MRLKHLNLHGFKTFAPRTDLVFGEGLTAIVGPNGSGKSNIADAIRWVLGEQSLSSLRAKKTEDLVFAGSSNRAPLGMAEVSISIDNSDRLLPVDFGEVTLTRRAYRSGENEYYINKSRVRLRDVLDIASTLGQAYTVVGQGLVDAALSLRPEERRELFEEAAAIRGYFVQREDALRRLTRTEENVARVNDLLSELEPQVRRMERQARQAQDYQRLESELQALLKTWYTGRWVCAVRELEEARNEEESASREVQGRKAELAARTAQLGEARAKVWELVNSVSALHEQRAQMQARHASQSQAQAVLNERLSAARLHVQTLGAELASLRSACLATQRQLDEAATEARERETEIAALEEEAKDVLARLANFNSRMAELQSQRDHSAAQFDRLAAERTELANRLEAIQRQIGEQERSVSEAEAAMGQLHQRLAAEESSLEERHAELGAAQRSLADAERELVQSRSSVQAAKSAQDQAEETRRELQRRADALASQLAALQGEQQANLYGGVRAVVLAAREGKLEGYVGTVAELLQVPAHLETAIEAALGGRLQEVVMSRWADVERAISLLKTSGAGRATFLPLDTLRASASSRPPAGPGIVGLACDLVDYDPSLGTLAGTVLGRLLIVEDLPAARKTLGAMAASAPWTLATLDGEVVRPGGSVTGGSNARADDARAKGRTILGRERKRRDLLASQEKLLSQLRVADASIERALEDLQSREEQAARSAARIEGARKRQVEAQMAQVEQQSAVSRLQQELAWRVGLRAEARKQAAALAKQEIEVSERRDNLELEMAPLAQTMGELDNRLRDLQVERSEVAQSAGAGQTRLAVLAEGLRNIHSRREEVLRELAREQAHADQIAQRVSSAREEEAALTRELQEHAREVEDLATSLKEIEDKVAPSEREVRVAEGGVSRIEAEHSDLQAALLQSETVHSRAAVEQQRCIGSLDSLRVEIAEELGQREEGAFEPVAVGVAEEGSGRGWSGWEVMWPPALSGDGSHDQSDHSGNGQQTKSQPDSAELERRVYALRARLSRLGPVNPLATEEHAALSERYDYLQKQLVDLVAAAQALQRVLGELDRTMREQFAATFAQVNVAFQHFFHALFNGGSARLELTNPEDVSASGIDIFAQPPGKRMQPLAALSGGERALTSVALICALLKVRPVPFCVLDEVDAALDESNVTRFRSALQELGDKTQFVVITHNRGTIEAANTLYGVSMAGDGTSQLLSLKVRD